MQSCARRRARIRVHAFVLSLPVLAALPGPSPARTCDGGRQDKTAPFPRAGQYAGEAVCKDCHEEQAEAIHGGVHKRVVAAAELKACETCHGPGKAHADHKDNDAKLITHPPDLGRGVVSFCGRCHAETTLAHGGDLAGFLAAGKTCTSCHRVHEKTPGKAPHDGVAFHARRELLAHASARAVGAKKCLECHPLRDELLGKSHHAHMAAARIEEGCESCHGPGALHVASKGLARLITRPDRAGDGAATCRGCHEHVDPVEFHWKDKHKPLLSAGMTCTTCHEVHADKTLADRPVLPKFGALARDGVTEAVLVAHQPVSNAMCARCHEPAMSVLHGTVHETLGHRDAALAQGCGSCHLSAQEHAEAGGRKDLVTSLRGASAAVQQQTCNQCHGHERALMHVDAGAHHRFEVSCLSCHSPAVKRGDTRQDAESKCASCHQTVAAEFLQPNHHPVPEGAMGCSDCHDPHGARSKTRDLELREERCVACHTQYRGPFVFAHQAGRSDGCVACHVPHGASNKRLLRQHDTQQNCLQCHGDFPIFHDQTPGAVFTNCLNCHTEVHGSNHARFLFR
jgi:DmsE family decaheme c-type cytochrome